MSVRRKPHTLTYKLAAHRKTGNRVDGTNYADGFAVDGYLYPEKPGDPTFESTQVEIPRPHIVLHDLPGDADPLAAIESGDHVTKGGRKFVVKALQRFDAGRSTDCLAIRLEEIT